MDLTNLTMYNNLLPLLDVEQFLCITQLTYWGVDVLWYGDLNTLITGQVLEWEEQ